MRKYGLHLVVILFMTLFIVGCNQDEKEPELVVEDHESGENVTLAEEFIVMLNEGQFEEATGYFDETMTAELRPAALEEIWNTTQEQVGKFIDQEYGSIQETEGYQVVFIKGLFEKQDVVFTVTFDENQKIAGFFIQ
ncbi:DUF3887 domain-containing protein [Bacillus sp. V3B]|uniref:DUF3887 domain-containing protein n=1 Tax=Bacillus sp. V3B TaxID=2804915 RepID=UPI00210CF00F|nr:DUF3887 domain-containing protein [Bacillus sp. V3B]MCQ6276889.1 DUF3887 domain-containing protein [Bacillus sp. V3B]